MPYPRAHWWVLGIMAVTVAGFWASYFSVFGDSPWQFHAHGVASTLWVLMVAGQSWTAHHKPQLPLHRAIGKSSLLLFPFLIGGLMAIIDVTAKGYVAGDGPVRTLYGGSFMVGLMLAIAAYVVLYYQALRHRRKVWLHSGYMLATPLILFESPFSRVLGTWVPAFAVEGPQDFHLIIASILWAMAGTLLIVAVIWWRVRRHATPFLVAGGFTAAQMVTMGTMGQNALMRDLLTTLGGMPSAAVVGIGLAIGAATAALGWQAGKGARRGAAVPA